MHPGRQGLWLVLVCASCGAADARDTSPSSGSGSVSPTADAALDRLTARCDTSCEPEEGLALAQHLLERAQSRRREAFAAEDRALTERDPVAQRSAREATAEAQRDAERDTERAIALLRGIAGDETVPPSHVVQTALAELLFALADTPAHDDVLAIAERIVRDAPTLPVAADAWLAIGERAFERAELARARDAYLATAAVVGADAQIVVYAKYKLAWTYFNLSDFQAACDAFREVARERTRPLLAREAQRDLLRALVPLGRAPADDVAEIRGLAQGDAPATQLAERYEQALRDVGLDARADAFRAAWR